MTGDKAHTRTIRDNELVSANNPFPEIPVTVPQIIRQAGHRTYQRGVAYQRNREVIRYSYDEDERTLTGLVNGSTIIPYEVTIRFFPAVSGSATFTARCTCPVLTDCKHAVALMLTALDRARTGRRTRCRNEGYRCEGYDRCKGIRRFKERGCCGGEESRRPARGATRLRCTHHRGETARARCRNC